MGKRKNLFLFQTQPLLNFHFVDVNQQEKETEKKKDQSNEYMTGKLDNF